MTKGKTPPPKAKSPAQAPPARANQGFTTQEKALAAAEVAKKFRLINDMDAAFDANVEKFIVGDATLSQLLGITVDQAYAFAEYAYTLYEQGRIREARQIFEALVVQNPADPYMHFMLGVIYAKMDMPEEAVEEYGNCIELDSQHIAAHTNRGEILLQHGEFEEALLDLKTAIKLDKKGDDPFARRARALASATSEVVKLMLQQKK